MTFSGWVNKWIYQMAHFGNAAFFTLTACLFGNPIYSLLAATAVCALKEGVFDPLTEDKTTQGSGWLDFLFLELGVLAGFAVRQLFIIYLVSVLTR